MLTINVIAIYPLAECHFGSCVRLDNLRATSFEMDGVRVNIHKIWH